MQIPRALLAITLVVVPVQLIPSLDVAIVFPFVSPPITTHRPLPEPSLPYPTHHPLDKMLLPRTVHVIPSELVAILLVPWPTATHKLFAYTTSFP